MSTRPFFYFDAAAKSSCPLTPIFSLKAPFFIALQAEVWHFVSPMDEENERLCFIGEFSTGIGKFLITFKGRVTIALVFIALGGLAWFAARSVGMAYGSLTYLVTWNPSFSAGLANVGNLVFESCQIPYGYCVEGGLGLFALVGIPSLIYFALEFASAAGACVAIYQKSGRLLRKSNVEDSESPTTWIFRKNPSIIKWLLLGIWFLLTFLGVQTQLNEIRLAKARAAAYSSGVWFGYDPATVEFNWIASPTAKAEHFDELLGWDFGTYQAPWTSICADEFNYWAKSGAKWPPADNRLLLLRRRNYLENIEKDLCEQFSQVEAKVPDGIQSDDWAAFSKKYLHRANGNQINGVNLKQAVADGALLLSATSDLQANLSSNRLPDGGFIFWFFLIASQGLLFGAGYTIAIFIVWKIAVFLLLLFKAAKPQQFGKHSVPFTLSPSLRAIDRRLLSKKLESEHKHFGLGRLWQAWESLLRMLGVLALYLCLQQAVPVSSAHQIIGPSGGTRATIYVNAALAGLFLMTMTVLFLIVNAKCEEKRGRVLAKLSILGNRRYWKEGEKYLTIVNIKERLAKLTALPPLGPKNIITVACLLILWVAVFPQTADFSSNILDGIKLGWLPKFPATLQHALGVSAEKHLGAQAASDVLQK